MEGAAQPTAEDHYRALGRYVAEFSQMVFSMQFSMVQKLGEGSAERQSLAYLAFAGTAAGPLSSSFFAMCAHVAKFDWETVDGKIAAALRKQVENAIRRRNDVAHGDLFIDHTGLATWHRVDTHRKQPVQFGTGFFDDLGPLTAEVVRLQWILRRFGSICLFPDAEKGHWSRPISEVFARKKIGRGEDAEWVVDWANGVPVDESRKPVQS